MMLFYISNSNRLEDLKNYITYKCISFPYFYKKTDKQENRGKRMPQ